MIIRNLQIYDLNKVQRLIIEQLFVVRDSRARVRLFVIVPHFIFNLPLGLLSLDTIIGSVAQTNDGHIIGVIIARRFPLSKIWVIGPMVVNKHHRRMGVGTGIMRHTLNILGRKGAKWVIVRVRVRSVARNFFEKFGFKYLRRIFIGHDQARKYARMMARTKFLYMTEERFSQEIDLKRPHRTWHIMVKKL